MTAPVGRPGWAWERGLFTRQDATVVWQNGRYRWFIIRLGKTVATGTTATVGSAMYAAEQRSGGQTVQ